MMTYLALRNSSTIRLVVFLLCSLHVFGNEGGDSVAGDDGKVFKGCFNKTTHHVSVEFTSNAVQNEYIVVFGGYFKKSTREKYISAALNNSEVSLFTDWIF